MKKSKVPRTCYVSLILFWSIQLCHGQQKITFYSSDSLKITADIYVAQDQAPYIILCHLSGLSRGEYLETAKKLLAAGYNCLALDARSGGEVFGVINETAVEARAHNKPTDFLDAEKDIEAAITYATHLSDGSVALLGSSYSASLCLKIAAREPKVKVVLAFSPGEHFGSKLNLKTSIKDLNKPVFVTSSRKETQDVAVLIEGIRSKEVAHFVPEGEGAHGSIALWERTSNHAEYWKEMLAFLNKFLK